MLQTSASNGLRTDYNPSTLALMGLLCEAATTNEVRNNTMQSAAAGTPGTMPTNWTTTAAGLAAGITVDVYVYNSDPTASSGVVGGDNAAFSNKKAGFRGRFRGTFTAFSDGGKAVCRPVDGDSITLPMVVVYPATGAKTIWLQYKAIAGFTPSANSTTIIPRVKGFQGRA